MQLPLAVKVYVAGVAALGVVSLLAWQVVWPVPKTTNWLFPLLFGALNGAAMLFPLRLSPSRKITVASAIQFAVLLLQPPALAILTIGGSTLAANLVLKARGKRDGWNVLFNTGQHALEIALAAFVLYAVLPHGVPFAAVVDEGRQLLALGAAGATLYLSNTWGVAAAVALQRRQFPWLVWWSPSRPFDILHTLGLYLVGLLVALTVRPYPWAALVMVLPVLLIFHSLRTMVQLTEETTASAAALRALSCRLRTAQEEERKRLSATLHDGPLQRLHYLLRLLEEGAPAEACRAIAIEAATELRATTAELRPPALDDLGLPCALASLARRIELWAGCSTTVDAESYAVGRLGAEVELVLYRIAQEALANCAKHAGASSITVRLRLNLGRASLEVVDDGQGLAIAASSPLPRDGQEHLGLLEMRECAQSVGGTFTLSSLPGRGTIVRVVVPLAVAMEETAEPRGRQGAIGHQAIHRARRAQRRRADVGRSR